jgi:hypothetical protein
LFAFIESQQSNCGIIFPVRKRPMLRYQTAGAPLCSEQYVREQGHKYGNPHSVITRYGFPGLASVPFPNVPESRVTRATVSIVTTTPSPGTRESEATNWYSLWPRKLEPGCLSGCCDTEVLAKSDR